MKKRWLLPWKLSVGYGLSNFFLVEILRFASQILEFTRWHPPKILRSSRQPVSTPHPSFFSCLDLFYIMSIKNYIGDER